MTKLYSLSDAECCLSKINRAADLAWSIRSNSIFVQVQRNKPLSLSIPEVSLQAAERRATTAREIIELLDSADEKRLSHDAALTAKVLRYYAESWRKDADRYWLCYDMLGQMYYGPFMQTAYSAGLVFNLIQKTLLQVVFENDADADRYLALLSDIVRLLKQIHARTKGQADRNVRIHKPELPNVRVLLSRLSASAAIGYRVGVERLSDLSEPARVVNEINRRIDNQILPSFAALIEQLDSSYEQAAPEEVGMDKLPGGREVYLDLLHMHTTLELSLEQVHQAGHDRMSRIENEMTAIRLQLGFKGTAEEFMRQLRGNPAATVESAEMIGDSMRRHKGRVEERFDEFFAQSSPADCDVQRLNPALESSITWGYYQAPTANEPKGIFFYNGSKLDSQAVIGAASLTFHELMPGHHLHRTTESSNLNLHPIRRYSFINAFSEGWAEYAATLAGEMGLYDDPYDHYGRLIFDAFLTSRLVVDTGMNGLGWGWDEAKQYLREHTLCSEAEIETDTLRYACGIPAQSLAYKLGDENILKLRQKTIDILGEDFDFRGFHSAVLGAGSLPLPALGWHLDWYIAESSKKIGGNSLANNVDKSVLSGIQNDQ